ncbi:hypothetical protein RVS70_05775 [Virgibacillus sp. M23]|uniref:hypothetical protein n=1 Tax=Virgibacillus sp. M23 TaxID=3079030 RepID=UPI002A909D5C|nr:hypothetical protein [Virgibacillus sp. M23]MDY7043710.1 hypothetical protein [Virgibacillus sp. M23]
MKLEFDNRQTIEMLKQNLIRGAILREPIYVTEKHRGCGKTTALIDFAKEFDFTVIVNEHLVKMIKQDFNYHKITSFDHFNHTTRHLIGHPKNEKFVHDEGISTDKINQLKNMYNLDIITGFSRR